jgi:hypothetical protein
MITIKLDDGNEFCFNLPSGKDQKFINIWNDHNDKSVTFKSNGKDINIKLSEIIDCYIGEKEHTNRPEDSYGKDFNFLKDFLGIK